MKLWNLEGSEGLIFCRLATTIITLAKLSDPSVASQPISCNKVTCDYDDPDHVGYTAPQEFSRVLSLVLLLP